MVDAKKPYKITVASLSGGMGKTSVALLMARELSERGYRVLIIDADPQRSLTFYSGIGELEPDAPSLLEFLQGEVTHEAVYVTSDKLWIIPSDRGLGGAEPYLSRMGPSVLRVRLKALEDLDFDFCFIDSPPEVLQLSLTAIAAADGVLIPALAKTKGVNSLDDTIALLNQLQEVESFQGEILGVVPFQDVWYGLNQVKSSRQAIDLMKAVAPNLDFFPPVRSSEQLVKLLEEGQSLSSLPSKFEYLSYPFDVLVKRIEQNVGLESVNAAL